MSDGTKNTDVSGNVTPPAEPTEQQATQTPGDSGAPKGLENRIYGLTAERDRLKEQVGDLQKRFDDLAEKAKTEQERAMDQAKRDAVEQFKKSEYEPVTTKAKAYEARLDAQVAKMREGLPAEVLPADFDERDTVYKFDFLSALTAGRKGQSTTPVGTSVNPQGPQAKRVVPGSEFKTWQSTNMYDADKRAEYESKKAEMMEAHREGRIDWTK